MDNEGKSTLETLKALAAGGIAAKKADPLELSTEMVANEESAETENPAEDVASAEEGAVADMNDDDAILENEPAEQRDIETIETIETVGTLEQLLAGDLVPALHIPLKSAADYDLMNSALRDGRIRVGAVAGEPHLILTNDAINDLIHEEKRIASEAITRIEKVDQEIENHKQMIKDLEEGKKSDLEKATHHSSRIRALQESMEA